jgi:hypothetical protein
MSSDDFDPECLEKYPLVAARLPQTRTGKIIFNICLRVMVTMMYLAWPGILGFILFQVLRWLAPVLATSHHDVLAYLIVSFFVLVVALVAYRFRCAARRFYGLTEIGFGIGTSLFAGSALLTTTELTQANIWQIIAPLMAGVYVCVRGLSNLDDALWSKPAQKPESPIQTIWYTVFYKDWFDG